MNKFYVNQLSKDEKNVVFNADKLKPPKANFPKTQSQINFKDTSKKRENLPPRPST